MDFLRPISANNCSGGSRHKNITNQEEMNVYKRHELIRVKCLWITPGQMAPNQRKKQTQSIKLFSELNKLGKKQLLLQKRFKIEGKWRIKKRLF
jgi:hypothetical protein